MNMFKKRKNTSLTDRKFYSERLGKLLTNPSLEDIETAYQLTYTEATDKNLEDILQYINEGSYLKLSGIKNRLPYVEDEFGETIDKNLYEIYLLIDNQQQFYIAVVYVQLVNKYLEKLISIKKVNHFLHQIFSNKRLVYPIK